MMDAVENDLSVFERSLRTIPALARDLMNQHGLVDWTFQIDRAKRRAGLCRYTRKTISLSYEFIARNGDEEVEDTILHEIAHAIAGPWAGHGPIWKMVCVQVGAKPIRCYDSQKVDMPEGRYQATCPNCQRVFHKHRKVRADIVRYCRKCGPVLGRLNYTKSQ